MDAGGDPGKAPVAQQEAEESSPNEETKGLTEGEKAVPEVKVEKNETKIELGVPKKEYEGLTKEELMKFANDPFWVRLRWALFILFWLIWVAMLVASIIIIIYAPKCPSPEPKQWWQKGPIYRVDVKKFKDSDNDSVGDLAGLESELDYLVDAGVNTILLSSFYKSPGKATLSYDISDYQDVDSTVGSLDSWRSLMAAAKARNLKVVVDLVPNHSSDQHEWFEKSVAREPGYEDYYVWRSGASPPDSWQAAGGGSGWTKNSQRGEWYLHNYGANQPDLNLDSPKVVQQLQSVMEFWLKEGVDGFNIDSVNLLVENFAAKTGDMDKSMGVVRQFREVVDRATEETGETKIIMATGTAGLHHQQLAALYGTDIGQNNIGQLLHLAVGSSPLTAATAAEPLSAVSLKAALDAQREQLPAQAWPTLALSPAPGARVAASQGPDMVDALNMLSLLLPGTPLPLFGDELGQTGEEMDWNQAARLRTAAEGGQMTHLSVYAELAKLRSHEALLMGDVHTHAMNSTFVLTRVKKGNPGYLLAINFAGEDQLLDISHLPNIAENIRVVATSTGPEGVLSPNPEAVKRFPATEVRLGPRQAVAFTFVPSF